MPLEDWNPSMRSIPLTGTGLCAFHVNYPPRGDQTAVLSMGAAPVAGPAWKIQQEMNRKSSNNRIWNK